MTTHNNDTRVQDMIAKVQALLNKTPERGATQAEAEAAAAAAQKLLIKYNLTLAQVRAFNDSEVSSTVEITSVFIEKTQPQWEKLLIAVLAENYLCRALRVPHVYYIVGTEMNARIVLRVFERLQTIIRSMTTKAVKEHSAWLTEQGYDPRAVTGTYSLKTYRASYQLGVVRGIQHKLATLKKEQEKETSGASTALIVQYDAAINQVIHETWGRLANPRTYDATINATACSRGFAEGKNLSMHRGELE